MQSSLYSFQFISSPRKWVFRSDNIIAGVSIFAHGMYLNLLNLNIAFIKKFLRCHRNTNVNLKTQHYISKWWKFQWFSVLNIASCWIQLVDHYVYWQSWLIVEIWISFQVYQIPISNVWFFLHVCIFFKVLGNIHFSKKTASFMFACCRWDSLLILIFTV